MGRSRRPRPQVATIHARYSNLVVVDVVVTDSRKNPIHGLKKSDFTLMENGKLQTIRHFEEHSEVLAGDGCKIAPAPKLPAGLFTNKSAAPANGPVNVLLLDYLNTPLTAQADARKQLIDYLDKAPAGTRIAIFGLTTQLVHAAGVHVGHVGVEGGADVEEGRAAGLGHLDGPVNGGPMATQRCVLARRSAAQYAAM